MPFKSKAQRRLFYAKAERGEIPKSTVKHWEEATGGRKLPERVKKALLRIKQANGENEEDEPPPVPGKTVPRKSLVSFFKENPAPEDAQVHELAEAYRVDPHVMESQVYRILGDQLKTKTAAYRAGARYALQQVGIG